MNRRSSYTTYKSNDKTSIIRVADLLATTGLHADHKISMIANIDRKRNSEWAVITSFETCVGEHLKYIHTARHIFCKSQAALKATALPHTKSIVVWKCQKNLKGVIPRV